MTKNTFIALAAALKATKPAYTPHDDTEDHGAFAYNQWCEDVGAVMGVLMQANPRFHRGRFLTACGIPNIGEK